MNKKLSSVLLVLAVLVLGGCSQSTDDHAAGGAEKPKAAAGSKKSFKVAWSIYVGWMPWSYAQESGILDKWAGTYGIDIELIRLDYLPSIEAFVSKEVDACVMTNMEALNMPAASGIDSTVLIMGDYSNGNDAILTRGDLGMADLPGKTINLVELSVSHYLLARGLEAHGLKESQVKVQNVSDADIAPVFLADESQQAVVTWNPMVMEIEQNPGIRKIYTSADIPGEIMDVMVANTDVLKANPELGRALIGAWYETMQIMAGTGTATEKAMASMAEAAGSSLVELKGQLRTTAMYYDPAKAVAYLESPDVKKSMDFVRKFCFDHGLLGEGVASVDVVGIAYPDGTVQGDRNNVKLRFDSSYAKMAAEGSPSAH